MSHVRVKLPHIIFKFFLYYNKRNQSQITFYQDIPDFFYIPKSSKPEKNKEKVV